MASSHALEGHPVCWRAGFRYSQRMSQGSWKFLLVSAALTPLLAPAETSAHILLTEPPPRVAHDNTKVSPCGENVEWGSNGVSTFAPGEQLTLQWDETISHPGYFRVALSTTGDDALVKPAEADLNAFKDFYSSGNGSLPTPIEQPSGMVSGDLITYYDYYAQHGMGECSGTSTGGVCKYEVALTLPTSCEQCTLQLVQVMAESFRNANNAYYYHCVDFKIEGDPDSTAGETTATGETTSTGGTAGTGATAGTGDTGTSAVTTTGTWPTSTTGGVTGDGATASGAEPTSPTPTVSELPSGQVPPPPSAAPLIPTPSPTAAPTTTAFPLTPPTAGATATPLPAVESTSEGQGGCSVALHRSAPHWSGWLLLASSLLLRRRTSTKRLA